MDIGLENAFRVTISKSELARRLGLKPQTVTQWEIIPEWWMKRVSDATGIPMLQLHPDTREALAKHMALHEAEAAGLNLPLLAGGKKE